MKQLIFAAVGAAVLGVAGCVRPPEAPPVVISDPYAGTGDVTIYERPLPAPDRQEDSAAWFRDNVGDTVLFPADQTTLTPEARAILARQAEWLTEHGGFRATIAGHADEKGTRAYNLALGARRAGSVQEYLIAQGVEAGRLRTNTWGKERPVEVCSSEACFARNRRAVTVVSDGVGS